MFANGIIADPKPISLSLFITHYHLSSIQCYLLSFTFPGSHLLSMDLPKHFADFNHTHQIKLMAQVLSKMAKFFNDMAEQCLTHLAGSDSLNQKERLALNRQTLRHFQNEKIIEKLDNAKQSFKQPKKDYVLKKIKSHKPKHPVSSFFIFYKEKGQQIAKKRGEILGSKIAKVVGELWKSMPQSQKQPYQAKSKLARQKYEEEMIQYKIKYTDELARLKQLKREARLRRKLEEDQKAVKAAEEKLEKDQELAHEAKDKQAHEFDQNQIDSSSQDSDLEDDLSNSLASQLQDDLKTENQIDLQSLKAAFYSQPKEQSKNEVQSKQNQIAQSSSLASYQQSSSHEYHQALFQPLRFENMSHLPHQPMPIETPIIQMLELQKEIGQINFQKPQTKGQKGAQHQQLNQEELCSIADSDMKSDAEAPPQQFIKPKGPVSSFFLFYREKGKWISETKGLPLGPKAIKVASEIWRGLSQQEKNVYMEQARQTRQQYYKNKQELKKKYGQDIFQKTKGRGTKSKNKKSALRQ